MNGWKTLSALNLATETGGNKDDTDTYYFFVDKANWYSSSSPFSKQLPFNAFKQIDMQKKDGTGAPKASYSQGNNVSSLQTWSLKDHRDVNSVVPVEFGYFLDGTKTSGISWEGGSVPDSTTDH